MTATHLPAGFITAYADGSLSEGMSLLVASHLTFCPACRDAVARLEAVGGAFLAQAEPALVPASALAAALARLDTPDDARALPADPDHWLPCPVRRALGVPLSDIRWAFRLPGLSEHRLDGFGDAAISLLRARPGVRIPDHTHIGLEATLVLIGEMRDGPAHYGRGDLSFADETCEHHPEIVGEAVCICLVVRTGRMHFTGRFGRALNLFT